LVPGAGLEPARSCDRGILSPFSNLLCMPFKGIFGVIWWNKGSFKDCKWVQFWVHKNKPAHQLPLGVNYPALKRVDTFGGLVLI